MLRSNDVLTLDKKIAMFLLAAYPVLNAYMVLETFTLANFIGLLLFLYCIIRGNNPFVSYPKLFLLFWLYATLHIIFLSGTTFKVTYLIPGGISFCLYAISFGVLCHNFDFYYLKKYLWLIFMFAVALFLVQLIVHATLGIRICCFIPITNQLAYSVTTYPELVSLHEGYEDRFASIFLEPSYFGQYALIVLTVELFCEENKEKLYTNKAIFIAVILLLIKSGMGLLGMLVVAAVKIIQVLLLSHKRKYYIYLAVLLPLIIFAANYYLLSDFAAGVSERASFSQDGSGEFEDKSTSLRLLYGFFEYENLDTFDKIIGTSMSNRLLIADRNASINGFSNSLITYGIIGTAIILLMHIKACRRRPVMSNAFAIILLVVSFFETILFDDFMLVCSVLIICYQEYERKPEHEIITQ